MKLSTIWTALLVVLVADVISLGSLSSAPLLLRTNALSVTTRRYHIQPKSQQLNRRSIAVPLLNRRSRLYVSASLPSTPDGSLFNSNESSNLKGTAAPVFPDLHEGQPVSSSQHHSATAENFRTAKREENRQSLKKNLYEILGADPGETRDELKRKYIALAKQSHPDALIGRGASATSASGASMDTMDSVADFTEIAAAWRILGDAKQRLRYDRTLQAEKISENIANWANHVFSKAAAPAAETSLQILEKIAMPFLRRTTETTIATVQAVTSNSAEAPHHVAQEASKIVIQKELQEKSSFLEQRAVSEYKKALALQHELRELAKQRLKITLRTSYSGITSTEALLVLQQMDNDNPLSNDLQDYKTPTHLFSSATSFWRTSNGLTASRIASQVEDEIQKLKNLEQSFIETQQIDSATQELYRDQVRMRLVAKTALQKAIEEEEVAKAVYLAAQKRVQMQQHLLNTVTSDLSCAESQAQKSSYEVERKHAIVEQQSEQVRLALLKLRNEGFNNQTIKNDNIRQHPSRNVTSNGKSYGSRVDICSEIHQKKLSGLIMNAVDGKEDDTSNKSNNFSRLAELAALRQKERQLAEQSSRLEIKAARLLSRANKLKENLIYFKQP